MTGEITLLDSPTYRREIEEVAAGLGAECSFLRNQAVLITGATGLIGSYLVDVLAARNAEYGDNIGLVLTGRSRERAKLRFGRLLTRRDVEFCEWNAGEHREFTPVSYVVHAASNADPVSFATDPVGTLWANVAGTRLLLEYMNRSKARRMLLVSTGEVYGKTSHASLPTPEEMEDGVVHWMDVRSSYPCGKRAAELLCKCYGEQYGTNTVIVRPCHVYGPTQLGSDSRAVAQFIRSAVQRADLILKSDGRASRAYCYVSDAVSAMLLSMQCGSRAEIYNIADERGVITVRALATLIAQIAGTRVVFQTPEIVETRGHSKIGAIKLDASKLHSRGWVPKVTMMRGLQDCIKILSEYAAR